MTPRHYSPSQVKRMMSREERAHRQAVGLCLDCEQMAAPDHRRCDDCLANHRERARRRYEERREARR
jgi:hypothetical protein